VSDGTILLVEDNPDDEELTLLALAEGDIQSRVTVVRDGVEALDFLFGQGRYADRLDVALPELVLLDLKLPKLGGLDVLTRVRADPRTRLLPIVVLTSSSEEADIVASYRLGANSYVRKPVAFQCFVKAVRELGRYWLTVNVRPPLQS
jgi:two-component system response regulator